MRFVCRPPVQQKRASCRHATRQATERLPTTSVTYLRSMASGCRHAARVPSTAPILERPRCTYVCSLVPMYQGHKWIQHLLSVNMTEHSLGAVACMQSPAVGALCSDHACRHIEMYRMLRSCGCTAAFCIQNQSVPQHRLRFVRYAVYNAHGLPEPCSGCILCRALCLGRSQSIWPIRIRVSVQAIRSLYNQGKRSQLGSTRHCCRNHRPRNIRGCPSVITNILVEAGLLLNTQMGGDVYCDVCASYAQPYLCKEFLER